MNSIFRSLPQVPYASAELFGTSKTPKIHGIVNFFQFKLGVLVFTEVFGLPEDHQNCGGSIYYMQIYEQMQAANRASNIVCSLMDSNLPYNPNHCAPPYHAGYLPPIIESFGYGHMSIFTGRFHARDVIGRAIGIHAPPNGDALLFQGVLGEMIACGVIQRT